MALKTGGTGNLQTLPGAQNLPGFNVAYNKGDSARENLEILREGAELGSDLKHDRISRKSEAETVTNEQAAKTAVEAAKQAALESDKQARTHESNIKTLLSTDETTLAQNGVKREEAVQKEQQLKDNAERNRNTAIAASQRAQILAKQAAADAQTEAAGKSAATAYDTQSAQEKQKFFSDTAPQRQELKNRLLSEGGSEVTEGGGVTTLRTINPNTGDIEYKSTRTIAADKGRPTDVTKRDPNTGALLQQIVYSDGSTGWKQLSSGSGSKSSLPKTLQDFVSGGNASGEAMISNARSALSSDLPSGYDFAVYSGLKPNSIEQVSMRAAMSTVSGGRDKLDQQFANWSSIKDTALSSMREILGSQFTQREGDNVINNIMDPGAKPETVRLRVGKFLDRLEATRQAKEEAAEYAQKNNGSLNGYLGFTDDSTTDDVENKFGNDILDYSKTLKYSVGADGASEDGGNIPLNEDAERSDRSASSSDKPTEVTGKPEMDNLPATVQYITYKGKTYQNPNYK